MMKMRSIPGLILLGAILLPAGCKTPRPQYGVERPLSLPAQSRQVWAVAPAINLSGREQVDPLLQADLVYQQLQQVQGLTVIPVNRVVEVYAALRIEKVQSMEQAALVCDLLGCDALLVATVTVYDPYNPPKLGASLALLNKPAGYTRQADVDPYELSRSAAPAEAQSLPATPGFAQAVGMFDAANGSVRDALFAYVAGRNDPIGPLGPKEYLVSMDRYSGFVYHRLIAELLD